MYPMLIVCDPQEFAEHTDREVADIVSRENFEEQDTHIFGKHGVARSFKTENERKSMISIMGNNLGKHTTSVVSYDGGETEHVILMRLK